MKLPEKLVFATNNAHKLQEARAIIDSMCKATNQRCKVLSLSDINCKDDIAEEAETLEGNALLKSQWVASHYGCDCFADDTGLEVDALGGMPGVHTARYAALADSEAASHDSDANMRLLLKNLENTDNRKAQFRTAIALIINGEEHVFEGKVEGSIARQPSGKEGFGYDPVFIPDGYDICFAEMPPEQKNSLSHRSRALKAMMQFFEEK